MRKFVVILSLVAVGLGLTAASALAAAVPVSESFRMPVQVDLRMAATGCSNSPGPQITMEGAMALSGLGVNLIFTNNDKGTHTYADGVTVDETLVSANHSVAIPKQPVLGGVGGNPYIWVRLTDENGTPMTSELFLGRCVQGSFRTTANLTLPVTAAAKVSASDCANAPGPYITLNGGMELSGLNAELIFRNSDNLAPHQTRDEMRLDAVLLPAGQSIQFPKQPVLGGVGGNPWISLGFLQGDGDPIGSETLLGRCVQMSK